jgi:hypothetical protein
MFVEDWFILGPISPTSTPGIRVPSDWRSCTMKPGKEEGGRRKERVYSA